jgi:hypothetical protein
MPGATSGPTEPEKRDDVIRLAFDGEQTKRLPRCGVIRTPPTDQLSDHHLRLAEPAALTVRLHADGRGGGRTGSARMALSEPA